MYERHMMISIRIAFTCFATFCLCHSPSPKHTSSCATRLIYQYPTVGTWIENIAVRSNGGLLLTSLNNPGGLSTLSPSKNGAPKQLVTSADLGYLNSTLGIVEAEKDVFYILAANYSLAEETLGTQRGTNALFRVRFCEDGPNKHKNPDVQLVKKFGKEVLSLNGLTKFNDTLLLAADSGLGAIWAIDAHTGDYYKLLQDVLMEAPDPQGTGFKEGINGVHFLLKEIESHHGGGTAYFTNSQKYLFGKIELDDEARAIGPAKWIADSITEDGVKVNWDDFALDKHENAWVATEPGNSVQLVTRRGMVEVVAGNVNSTALAEPTSASFGRTEIDLDILYVATSGGMGFPVWENGKEIRLGAQIVAVDTSPCSRRIV